MLQFRPHPVEAVASTRLRDRRARRQRFRLWMLLIALGLVVATMRQLNSPNTAKRLGQIFGEPEVASQQKSEEKAEQAFVLKSGEDQEYEPLATRAVSETLGKDASETLSGVKDNTYFRPEESAAWFGLFERLQQTDTQKLQAASLGEMTYAQLVKQPEVYRGQAVTLRGTMRLEEPQEAPENSLGIESYHRLWISPKGGGPSLFAVYCLELPEGFPRGKKLHASVSVTGYFFKNWSYASQGGMAIAPVVLASNVDWEPAATPAARKTISSEGLSKTLLIASVFAVLAMILVLHNTRRPRRSSPASESLTFPEATNIETIDEQLQRLAEREPHE